MSGCENDCQGTSRWEASCGYSLGVDQCELLPIKSLFGFGWV